MMQRADRKKKYPFVKNIFYSISPKIFRVDLLTQFFFFHRVLPVPVDINLWNLLRYRSANVNTFFSLLLQLLFWLHFMNRELQWYVSWQEKVVKTREKFFFFFFFFFHYFQWNKKHSRFIATYRDIA